MLKKYVLYFFLLALFIYEIFKVRKNKKRNSSIYNLRINHLKNPFGIDIKDNSFSFLSTENGPFKAFLMLENKIIESKNINLEECHSFSFKNSLEYNKVYKYVVQAKMKMN